MRTRASGPWRSARRRTTVAAALLALVAPVASLTLGEAMRVVVTAGLVAALGSFAIQQARGDA